MPYKENYTKSKASAASLWVSEFYKYSKFKKNNYIVGSTSTNDYLTKNYINIDLKNINNKFFSTTKEYSLKVVKFINNENFDLVEIHNRPLILNYLYKKIKAKIIFYFHNDPLSMKGSRTINERIEILKKSEKIIFVSRWVQNRFFQYLDKKLKKKTDVIYPSVNKTHKLRKKNKIILFIGKLNESKGYHLFKDAIIKILNKYPDWKAFSIGDEERRDIFINHKNHQELGFLNHEKVINLLDKSEIAVVPSKWEEPFGRTALEATSRGCATIISNKGGLPETSDYNIVLKNLNSYNLFKKIDYLIKDKKIRSKIQINSLRNVKHIIKDNSKIIDNIRESCSVNLKINYHKNNLKIINLYNVGQTSDHRLFNISLGKKFTKGFIRNGNDVIEISDRDFLRQNKLFFIRKDINLFQKHLISVCKNYNPNLLLFGHTNNIFPETLDEIKNLNKDLIISQWNEDPIMPNLDYSKKNLQSISKYLNLVDHTFITTHPSVLKKNYPNFSNYDNLHFFFVPVDKNIEQFSVYNLNPQKDIFYAMSHGVNRGTLKKGKTDDRINFLNQLITKIPEIKYDFYGFKNQEPIWGNNFYRSLINSKMGLNLSRGNPTKYYSSNRIASIMGNGLLTFIDKKIQFQDFFSDKEIIFYSSINDLSDKIKFYADHDSARIAIAKKGKDKYFKLFNEKNIASFILNKSLGKNVELF